MAEPEHTDSLPQPEPRWPAILAILAAGLVYAALPENISVGPSWLLVALVAILEIPTLFFHWRGLNAAYRVLGYVVSGIMTLFLVWSLVLLVRSLPGNKESGIDLLQSGATLWVSNVIVFSLWYWRLDAGGPTARQRVATHTEGAFLFPQMTLKRGARPWSPRYIDYLFVAFNTSTALSPTDTAILSRWAKVLVMIQALVSLTVVAMLAGRAVNIL